MATDQKKLKPAEPGMIVRFPGNPSRRLSDIGEEVAMSPYWVRRLKAGDVVEVKAAAQSSGKASAAKE